jgi:PAS domain S-box-containing protein
VTEELPFRDRTLDVACTAESVGDLLGQSDSVVDVTVVDAVEGPLSAECLVVTDPAEVSAEQSTPTVLFTRADPMEIDRETLTAVETVVQRERSDSTARLVEKLHAAAGGQQPTTAEAPSPLEPPLAAFVISADGAVEWASHDPEALFGGCPESTGESLYDWLAQSLARSPNSVTDLLDAAEHSGTLLTVAAEDGYRQYRHECYLLPDGDRLELFADVTAELARRDRLDRLSELVENTRDGLFVLDTDGAVTLCNRAFAELLGVDQERIEGAHVSALLADSAYPEARERLRSGLAADRDRLVLDTALEDADGNALDVEISLTVRRDDDGRYVGALGVVRDVFARDNRRQELKRYGAIIEAVGSPVCTLDETGQLRYVNRQFREQFGADTLELLGEPLDSFLDATEADRLRAALERVVDDTDRTTESLEVEVTPQTGSPVPTDCRLGLLPPTAEETDAVVAVFHDITRLKRREQRLSKFASVVSHDLRNPMDVALGRAEMLPEIADVAPQTERHLDDIYESLKRMERLIQNVLTLTRQRGERVDTEPVAIAAVAEAAWANVSTGESDLRAESDLEIEAHRSRLLRLFENLFRNAVQHADSAVTVCVDALDTDQQTGFCVSDTGPGIPDQHREQIFEDGFTTDGEGTGLGLAIVREIARAHGWEVTLGEDTAGACFEFREVEPATNGDGD